MSIDGGANCGSDRGGTYEVVDFKCSLKFTKDKGPINFFKLAINGICINQNLILRVLQLKGELKSSIHTIVKVFELHNPIPILI